MEPFTLPHFRAWAAELTLDNDEPWILEPFQEWFLEDFFSGVPESWLIIPEGNAKTTLLAGIGLYHCEFKSGAMVPVAASARDQAEVMYRQAEGFVLRSPRLKLLFKCQEGYRRIKGVEAAAGSRIQVYAADDRTGDGIIPTLALVDELHRHRDLRLYRVWRGKLRKRNGQIVTISTAGEPGGEFEVTREAIRQGAKDVRRDGCFVRAADDGLILHEWAVPEAGDIEDLELVKRANPLPAVTLELLTEARASKSMTIPHWRRFVCNLPTRESTAAIQEAEWESAALGLDEWVDEGVPIWAGLDLAWKWDTTALVPFWWRDSEHRVLGPPEILVPPRDGTSLAPEDVEAAILRVHDRNPLHTVVMDTSKGEQLAKWIERQTGATVVDRQQTIPMAVNDYDKFMEGLRGGWLHHTGDQGLKQHALNAVAKVMPRGDAVFERQSQSRSASLQDRRVIDALTASAMVHSVAVAEHERPSVAPMVTWA